MFLLDTNVISDLRRPHLSPALTAWTEDRNRDELFISVVTLFEVRYGALSLARRDAAQGQLLQNWLSTRILTDFASRTLDITPEVALACAPLHIPNKRGERDAYIAATALIHDLTVVTRNTRDFEGTGVRLVNPWHPNE